MLSFVLNITNIYVQQKSTTTARESTALCSKWPWAIDLWWWLVKLGREASRCFLPASIRKSSCRKKIDQPNVMKVSLYFGPKDLSMCLTQESDFACHFNFRQILTQITFRRSANAFFWAINDSFPQPRSFSWRLDFARGLTNDRLGLFLTWNTRD